MKIHWTKFFFKPKVVHGGHSSKYTADYRSFFIYCTDVKPKDVWRETDRGSFLRLVFVQWTPPPIMQKDGSSFIFYTILYSCDPRCLQHLVASDRKTKTTCIDCEVRMVTSEVYLIEFKAYSDLLWVSLYSSVRTYI